MKRYVNISMIFFIIGIVLISFVTYEILLKQKHPKVNMTVLGTKYTNHFFDEKTKINVFWKINKNKIHFALVSPGKGWVGIGFNPKGPVMNGADIFMGFVKNGKTYINEEYANTPYSHEPITQAGGKDCILSYKGESTPDGTILTFERNLKSCGLHDKTISNKDMTVMLAYSNGKNFTKYHGPNHNEVHINFFKNTKKQKSYMITSHLSSYQIGLIAWALLFILAGIIGFASSFVEKDVNHVIFIKKNTAGMFPFLLIFFLSAGELACAIWLIVELYSNAINSLIGIIAGFNFILMALIVLFYRKFYIDDEIIAQDINDEIPW
ncbi:MAG: DOMON domain-containing protein [Desulfurella sp.]|uniref:DOMON domain-containing protein n=1 Tax=Desulfurella sp. TaxID=1962857 RepID=UPI003D09F1F5